MQNREVEISVIIPVYNGEKYIVNCLESIRKQKRELIEVVIINDGSTDASIDVIKQYQENHGDDIKIRVYHQNNAGQGAARNTGIENAYGKYVIFLDQDDTLVANVLSSMFLGIENAGADILIGGYQRVSNGVVKRRVRLQQEEWSKYRIVAPWGKIYKRDFLIRNNIRFMPVVLGEDIYFMLRSYCYNPKVEISKEIYYNWTDNKSSVSNTEHKKLSKETSVLNLLTSIECMPDVRTLKENLMYEYFLLKTVVWDILYTAVHNETKDVLENEEAIWSWIEHNHPHYRKNPYLGITTPKGEAFRIRVLVWMYVFGKRWNFNIIILNLISR